jgi:hypothetical protein
MKPPRLSEEVWLRQTMEQSIIASLQRRISPDELIEEHWAEFKDKMEDGGEVWYFRTPEETWTEFFPRCGMEGYALVRGDNVVAEVLTSMS